ncbi:MAG: hypothetical protein K6T72_12800 [Anoxybacillus sp.]|nr:hypothetical protein [Anoxybacillus sp.]MCL6587364.1 hypothetical protein [Anoxybacillus sp.]
MKVQTAIDTLEKVLAILKQYESVTVDEMLTDLSVKLSSARTNKSAQQAKADDIPDYTAVIQKVKTMNKEEAISFLSRFKKDDIIAIGQQMNIRLKGKDQKKILIETIINHYGFIHLHTQRGKKENAHETLLKTK